MKTAAMRPPTNAHSPQCLNEPSRLPYLPACTVYEDVCMTVLYRLSRTPLPTIMHASSTVIGDALCELALRYLWCPTDVLSSSIFPSFCFCLTRRHPLLIFFFFNDPAPTEISPLPLHDAFPIPGGEPPPCARHPTASVRCRGRDAAADRRRPLAVRWPPPDRRSRASASSRRRTTASRS